MSDTNVAMDYMNGLDNHIYARFKVDLINNIGQKSVKVQATLNEMYASKPEVDTWTIWNTTDTQYHICYTSRQAHASKRS